MPSRSKKSAGSSVGVIVALLVVLASVATLAYLPFLRGSSNARVLGVFAILGGVVSLVWWFLVWKQGALPLELMGLAVASGCLYVVALVVRVVTSRGP